MGCFEVISIYVLSSRKIDIELLKNESGAEMVLPFLHLRTPSNLQFTLLSHIATLLMEINEVIYNNSWLKIIDKFLDLCIIIFLWENSMIFNPF